LRQHLASYPICNDVLRPFHCRAMVEVVELVFAATTVAAIGGAAIIAPTHAAGARGGRPLAEAATPPLEESIAGLRYVGMFSAPTTLARLLADSDSR
jgi:hypothetical protein